MRKAVYWITVSVAGLVFFGAMWVALQEPERRPPEDLTVELSPERIARGTYLATHVARCVHCHSQQDTSKFGRPVIPGTEGAGGMCLGPSTGFEGRICPPNITPDPETGIGRWTDGELLRAMREGVNRRGEALFPMMPYEKYRHALSDEDAHAIIAWMRSLPPQQRPTPRRDLPFPLGIAIKTLPAIVEGPVQPPRDTAEKRGWALAELAGCPICHTPIDARHHPVEERHMAGGRPYPLGEGAVVTSANLTPHPDGLGDLSLEGLGERLGRHASPAPVEPARNTVMPWQSFAGMEEADLADLHAWLRSLRPLPGAVQPWGGAAEN